MAPLEEPRRRPRRMARYTERSAWSRPAIAAISHDRRLGGPLLAGALAFRLFAVLLPLALLVAALVGTAGATAVRGGHDLGIREATLRSVAQSSKLEADRMWFVVACAVVALLFAAIKAARAVHAVHGLAWDGAVCRMERPVGGGLAVLLTVAAVAVVWAAVGALRAQLGTPGLVPALLALVPFFGIWLAVSLALPHGDAPWTALVPGAVLVAIGLQVIHLGTVLVMGKQLARASATYGPLGAAFTILVWLYVVSRVIVGAAMVNAALRQGRAAESGGLVGRQGEASASAMTAR